jgi:para-nitrobenzyl esterase
MAENLMQSRRSFLMAGASIAIFAAFGARAAANESQAPMVVTTNGPVNGTVENMACVFKGIRYGAPPTGSLRFMPPRKPARWRVAPANAFGSTAMQMASAASSQRSDTPLGKIFEEFIPTIKDIQASSEDCLFLNVWTKSRARLNDGGTRPVMVWLHGGCFATGSGAWLEYDGGNLAAKGDVVVVTLNHRLNALGFLELADIGGAAFAASGNVGMLDIVAALEWVRDNIASFGGDSGNVTIFGESGGGMKVSTLMAMPAARGLFHRAIVESGPGLKGISKAVASQGAKDVMAELKISDIKALQAVPADQLISAANAVSSKTAGRMAPGFLAPLVDGVVLPSDPFDPAAPAISAEIPLIIGTNKDEMALFMASQPSFGTMTDQQLDAEARSMAGEKGPALIAALRKVHPDYSPSYLMTALATALFMWCGSIKLAERKADQQSAPVYMYQLRWETPLAAGFFKSPHMLEIPMVFDNVEKSRGFVGPGPAPQIVADQMSAAWLAFARTGNPNNSAIPIGPPYDAAKRATMIFDLNSTVENDPYAEVRRALASG